MLCTSWVHSSNNNLHVLHKDFVNWTMHTLCVPTSLIIQIISLHQNLVLATDVDSKSRIGILLPEIHERMLFPHMFAVYLSCRADRYLMIPAARLNHYAAGGSFGQSKMNPRKMTEIMPNGYPSESSQREVSNEYQHDRVKELYCGKFMNACYFPTCLQCILSAGPRGT